MAKTKEASAWLVLTPQWRGQGEYAYIGGMRIDRMTKKRPDLAGDELACRITVRIPEAAFTRPRFDIAVDVPEEALVHPEVIEAEVEVQP